VGKFQISSWTWYMQKVLTIVTQLTACWQISLLAIYRVKDDGLTGFTVHGLRFKVYGWSWTADRKPWYPRSQIPSWSNWLSTSLSQQKRAPCGALKLWKQGTSLVRRSFRRLVRAPLASSSTPAWSGSAWPQPGRQSALWCGWGFVAQFLCPFDQSHPHWG